MKNIPLFMGHTGTASLILAEIPHRRTAYIQLRTILPGGQAALIAQCAEFCRGCGAEFVYVSQGPEPLEDLDPVYDMLLLHTGKDALPPLKDPVPLLPMTPENDPIYQRTYNICFQNVPNAATYDRAQIRRIYDQGQRAFLALDAHGTVCGMGELHGNELAAIGLLPAYRGHGRSRDLALTLLGQCPGPELTLTVVSCNEPALALYDSLGFRVSGRISRWYAV